MTDQEILQQYKSGTTLRQLAKQQQTRTTNIREALQRCGINTAQLRGIRIGIAQKGQAKSYVVNNTSLNDSLTNQDWAYIAGLFDGEGCLGKDRWNNFRITISQNGTTLHEWLLGKLGQGVMHSASSTKGNHYAYRLSAQLHIFQFLEGVKPYCIVKADKIKNALLVIKDKYGLESKTA